MAAPVLPIGPVALVLSKLPDHKRAAGGWMAKCPAHPDHVPSLTIAQGRDGRALVKCHRGCELSAIVAALDLSLNDLFVESKKPTTGPDVQPITSRKIVATYDYQDEQGNLLFQAVRYEPKDFRQRRPDGKGGWVWSLADTRLVPYRLPELHQWIAEGRTILIVEGEKDAETLIEAGYPATCNPMGAGKWKDEFSALFRGATVAIVPDNDEKGRQHAEQVGASLKKAGAAVVKVCTLPGLPEKGDVSDWLDVQGHDLDELDAEIGKAPLWGVDPRRRNLWRLDELWENDYIMRPPPAIVPRLAWSGRSTLFAGMQKGGKSTFLGSAVSAVTQGSHFLGEPCQQGPVLWVGLEEAPGDTARRMRHFGADPTRFHLMTRFLADPKKRTEELRETIESLDPVLVVVDSLAAFSNGLVQDENNASQWGPVIQPLTDLIHEAGVALILIHHATKSTGKTRGSTAIPAAVDMVVEFLIPDEERDPTLRQVRSKGRIPVQHRYDVRFNGDTYGMADAAEAPIEERIIAIVRNRPGCSTNDVCEAIGKRHHDTRTAIGQMLAAGVLMELPGSHERFKKLAVRDFQPRLMPNG